MVAILKPKNNENDLVSYYTAYMQLYITPTQILSCNYRIDKMLIKNERNIGIEKY